MVLPAKNSLQPSASATVTNYLSTDRSLETLYTVRGSVKVPVLKGGTFSIDVGEQVKTKFPEGEVPQTTRNLALEGKYNQQLTDHTSIYFRGRKAGDIITGRTAFTVSYPITDYLNGYSAIHGTLRKNISTHDTAFTAGAWTGIGGKIGKNADWFTEVQYNFGKDWMWNSGIKIKLF